MGERQGPTGERPTTAGALRVRQDADRAAPADPVDQLVPAPRGRVAVAAFLAVVVVVLIGLALLPVSGIVRPRLDLSFSPSGNNAAGWGTGSWEYRLDNDGVVGTTVESFDIGVPAVTLTSTTYVLADDPTGAPLPEPVSIPAGGSVLIRLSFTYDCALVPDRVKSRPGNAQGPPVIASGIPPVEQRSTIQARGVAPRWFTVDLGSGDEFSGWSSLVSLLGAACDQVAG